MPTVTNISSLPTPSFVNTKWLEASASMAAFQRPNDANAYAAGDVVSNSTGTAASLLFPGAGGRGHVVGASLLVGETDTAAFDLFVFDSAPTDHLDNAALALQTADFQKLIGVYRFTDAAKVNGGTDFEVYRAVDPLGGLDIARRAYSAPNFLYGLLVTRSVFTPAAQTRFVIRLALELNGG